jgi:DNA transposition AAA+ family ATPase
MATSYQERKRLMERGLPADREMRERVRDYEDRTGLVHSDIARRINYATSTVNNYLNGHYYAVSASTLAIRAALLDFMEAHPVAAAEEMGGRLYETENVRILRQHFYSALDNRRAVYCYGPPGTQKSYVLKHLIAELNRAEISKNGLGRRAFYVYCRKDIRPHGLLRRVAEAAGSCALGDVDRILKNLRFDFGPRKVLLVLDEAQNLEIPPLETVRELLDERPYCGLLFAGSHRLARTFRALELEQWKSRIHAGRPLPGISLEEAEKIVRGELGADVKAKAVHELIEEAHAKDVYSLDEKKQPARYISARSLFWSLQRIKEKKEARA